MKIHFMSVVLVLIWLYLMLDSIN